MWYPPILCLLVVVAWSSRGADSQATAAPQIAKCFGSAKLQTTQTAFRSTAEMFTVSASLQANDDDGTSASIAFTCTAPGRVTYVSTTTSNGAGSTVTLNAATGALQAVAPSREGITSVDVSAVCRLGSTPATYADQILCRVSYTILWYAPAASITSPPTTLPPTTRIVTGLPSCPAVYGVEVATNAIYSDTLALFPGGARCSSTVVTSFGLLRTARLGSLAVNGDGSYTYMAPSVDGSMDDFDFVVSCNGIPSCQGTMFMIASAIASTQNSPPSTTVPPATTTQAPSTIAPPVACPNVYYMNATASGVNDTAPTNTSLALVGYPGELACARYANFSVTSGPMVPGAAIVNNTIQFWGGFVYVAPTTPGWDRFSFTIQCQFGSDTDPSRLVPWACTGTANILVLPQPSVTPPPTPSPPPTAPPVLFVPSDVLQCWQSCNQDAWKSAHHLPNVWDTTLSDRNDTRHVMPRFDGTPIDALSVAFGNGVITVTANGKIGNMAARFPTFDPVLSTTPLTADALQPFQPSVPFDTSCLGNQWPYGAGEEVWTWTNITNLEGVVGYKYRRGDSYYQKFGGKHIGCDTFADACRFAPFATPKRQTTPEAPLWSLQVRGCDTTWSGVLNKTSVLLLVKSNGQRIFQRRANDPSPSGSMVLDATLFNEAVKPRSWLSPAKLSLTMVSRAMSVSATLSDAVTVVDGLSLATMALFPALQATPASPATTGNSTTTAVPFAPIVSSNASFSPPVTTASVPAATAAWSTGTQGPFVVGDVERFTYLAPTTRPELIPPTTMTMVTLTTNVSSPPSAPPLALNVALNVIMYPRETNLSRAPRILRVDVLATSWTYPTPAMMCPNATGGAAPGATAFSQCGSGTFSQCASPLVAQAVLPMALSSTGAGIPDCASSSALFVAPRLGPAATQMCPAKLTFLSNGVPGLSDTAVCSNSVGVPDRSLNITARFEYGGIVGAAPVDLFPEGSITLAITYLPTGTSIPQSSLITVALSATLGGLAPSLGASLATLSQLVAAAPANTTIVTPPVEVALPLCRANRLWPSFDPLGSVAQNFAALTRRSNAISTQAAKYTASQFQCVTSVSDTRVIGAQDTIVMQVVPNLPVASANLSASLAPVVVSILYATLSVDVPAGGNAAATTTFTILLANQSTLGAVAAPPVALPWSTFAAYLQVNLASVPSTDPAGVTTITSAVLPAGSQVPVLSLVPGAICSLAQRAQPAHTCTVTVEVAAAVSLVTTNTSNGNVVVPYVSTTRRQLVVSTGLTATVRTGVWSASAPASATSVVKATSFLSLYELRVGDVVTASASDQQSSAALLLAMFLAGGVMAVALVAALLDDDRRNVVWQKTRTFARAIVPGGSTGKSQTKSPSTQPQTASKGQKKPVAVPQATVPQRPAAMQTANLPTVTAAGTTSATASPKSKPVGGSAESSPPMTLEKCAASRPGAAKPAGAPEVESSRVRSAEDDE